MLNTFFSKTIQPYSLVVFRVLFGLFMAGSLIRFWAKGWIAAFYIHPTFHFTFDGFSWIQPWPAWGMYIHFAALILLALCIASGTYYRISCLLFFLGFTYIELLDKTYYLNHYYAISLFSFLLIVLPLHQSHSVDAWRNPTLKQNRFPLWALWALRLQIGVIYFFAGIAKLNTDWLVLAQPLTMWLSANTHLPLVGSLLGYKATAYAMSWIGALFDLTVAFLLCLRKTRPFAYAAVIVFHVFTALLFSIGVFPWMMIILTLIFFDPTWPAPLFHKLGVFHPETPHIKHTPHRGLVPFFILYFSIQLLLPFHYLLYPGNLFWTEQGFRFSWRVMLMEKIGMIEFKVYSPSTQKTWIIPPSAYLTPLQEKMMSTQPDMILQFAHFLGRTFKPLAPDCEVYAVHSYVSINGRPSQPYINPNINLLTQNDPLFKPREFLLQSEKP